MCDVIVDGMEMEMETGEVTVAVETTMEEKIERNGIDEVN